jgi:hypothetical protein
MSNVQLQAKKFYTKINCELNITNDHKPSIQKKKKKIEMLQNTTFICKQNSLMLIVNIQAKYF